MVVSVSRHIWMCFFFWKKLSPLYYNIFQRHRVLYFRNIWLEYFILYTFFPVHFAFYDALEWLSSNESLEKLHRIFLWLFFVRKKPCHIESRGLKMRLCQFEDEWTGRWWKMRAINVWITQKSRKHLVRTRFEILIIESFKWPFLGVSHSLVYLDDWLLVFWITHR